MDVGMDVGVDVGGGGVVGVHWKETRIRVLLIVEVHTPSQPDETYH